MALMDDIEFRVYRSHLKIPIIFLVPLLGLLTVYVLVYFYVNSTHFARQLETVLHNALGGHFHVSRLEVAPSLTNVRIYEARLDDLAHRPVIEARKIEARLSPLLLITNRIQFERGVAQGARVHVAFDEQGRMNLLQALGISSSDDEKRSEKRERTSLSVGFENLQLVDSEFQFSDPRFEFSIPKITVPNASIFIEPATVLMSVDHLQVPEVSFRFQPELFRFDQEQGPWTFSATDFVVKNWRWANDGYFVEHISATIEGYHIAARGRMGFPSDELSQGASMVYDARGSITAPFWSPLPHYFTRDNIHFEIPSLEIAVQGTLDEIDGVFSLHASVLEVAGLYFHDLHGDFQLENRFIKVKNASMNVHGGQAYIPFAYFNLLEAEYGALFGFIDINPARILEDLNIDLEWLAGRAQGEAALVGKVPLLRDYRYEAPYPWLTYSRSKYVDMVLTAPLTLERVNRELFPVDTARLQEQSHMRVDMEWVEIPYAQMWVNADHFELHNFRLHYPSMVVKADEGGNHAGVRAYIQDVGPYASGYGMEMLSGGPLVAQGTLRGYLGLPQIAGEFTLHSPTLKISSQLIDSEEFSVRFDVDGSGRLNIESLQLKSDFADITSRGGFELWRNLSREERSGKHRVLVPESPSVQGVSLDIEGRDIQLAYLNSLVHEALETYGEADAQLKIRGTLDKPEVTFAAQGQDIFVRQQLLDEFVADGFISREELRLDDAFIKTSSAGEFQGRGRYHAGTGFDFVLQASAVQLESIRELARGDIPLRGKGDFILHGNGSLSAPQISGSGRFFELQYAERDIGNTAFVAHTLDDKLHVSGALLPWANFALEIPLKGKAPYYARFNLEHLDLVRALPELQEHIGLERTYGTGYVELFLDHDFSRYSAQAHLSDLQIDWFGQPIRNRGPVVIGWNNGEMLHLQQVNFGSGGRFLNLKGAMILSEPLLLDLEVQGELNLALLDSMRGVFPELLPEFLVESVGHVAVDARLQGTPLSLATNGRMQFGPAEFSVRPLAEPITVSSGTILFDSDGMVIPATDPITGTMLGGMMRVAGEIDFSESRPTAMDVRFWSHNMSYRVPELMSLTFDTDVRLLAQDVLRYDTWLFSGEVDVLDGLFYRDISIFEKQLTGRVLGALNRRAERYEGGLLEQLPMLNEIGFDLFVRARDGFRLRNQIERLELDLEFRVDLHLRETLSNPQVTGDIEVIDGSVVLQGETFDVRSGTVRFTDDLDNPWVDIIAGADFRSSCAPSDWIDTMSPSMTLQANLDTLEQRYFHITLNVRGHLDNLDIIFESQPYADQRDILSLLLTGCTVDQLTATSASRPTLEIALGPLLGRLEREIQEVVKVEEFTIMPGVERTQVRISDTLTRRLSWRFQLDTGFAEATGGQLTQLEYKLSDSWSAELTERSRSDSSSFLIDLKLKYRLRLD